MEYVNIINQVSIENEIIITKHLPQTKMVVNNNKLIVFENKQVLFHYIWFIGRNNCECECDCETECEFEFWNNYKIKIDVGELFIFPSSWCFPYKMFYHNKAIYIIEGYILYSL